MIIDDLTFNSFLSKINTGSVNPVFWKLSAEFRDEYGGKIPVHNVISEYVESLYDKTYSDNIAIEVQLIKSDYLALLATNRTKLSMHLTRTQIGMTGLKLDIPVIVTDVYTAKLTENKSEAIETRIGGLTGGHTDDLGEFVEVNVQLTENGLMEFRLIEVGGIYRNVAVDTLLQGLLSTPVKRLNQNGTTGYNVSIYQVDNFKKFYQLRINNGVKLVDLPNWVQHKWGVYSTGMGNYLTQGMWRIYPLYDVKRFDKESKRLTIVNVPQNEMIGSQNTYRIEGNEIYIFVTGSTHHTDSSDRSLDKTGTGIRASKIGNVLDKYAVSSGGVTAIPSGRNNVVVSFDDRDDDRTNIRTPTKMLSSNMWAEASKVIKGMGNYILVHWENSNRNLLYPGMPIKLIYKYRGTAFSIKGTLLRAITNTSSPMSSVLDTRYSSNTDLVLYTERANK